jgi:hypothetical protein
MKRKGKRKGKGNGKEKGRDETWWCVEGQKRIGWNGVVVGAVCGGAEQW